MSIGFIGLGNMGSGMAKNLLAAGISIVGFDTDSQKITQLNSPDFQIASSPSEIAKNCETVILCLPNPEVSSGVIFEQLLVDESIVKLIIETSTLTPEIVTDFASKLKARNIQFLSSPMIGGKNHAANGAIEFLVEGSKELHEDSEDVFNAMGNNSRFMGDFPSATLAKLTFNLVGTQTLLLALKLTGYFNNITPIYQQFTTL